MKTFALLAILASGLFQTGNAKASHEVNSDEKMCITADRIIKPIRSWKILNTEIHYEGKNPYMEVTAHNLLNKKTPTSVDARFILSIDPSNPSDPQKYNLVRAIYFNEKNNVVFKRIYTIHEVTVKNKTQKFPIQTPCFKREVIEILEFTPEEIDIPHSSPDDGKKKK